MSVTSFEDSMWQWILLAECQEIKGHSWCQHFATLLQFEVWSGIGIYCIQYRLYNRNVSADTKELHKEIINTYGGNTFV
jgi:hypothetical protein